MSNIEYSMSNYEVKGMLNIKATTKKENIECRIKNVEV